MNERSGLLQGRAVEPLLFVGNGIKWNVLLFRTGCILPNEGNYSGKKLQYSSNTGGGTPALDVSFRRYDIMNTACPRYVGAKGRLMISRPFKPIFFDFQWPRKGRACSNWEYSLDKIIRVWNPGCTGTIFPFPITPATFCLHYRLSPRAAARLARPQIRPGSECELTKRLTEKSVLYQ
jgi:hypothetical protein